MKARDRYRFVEQTCFFPSPAFAANDAEEALSYIEDHVKDLQTEFPQICHALSFQYDCEGEAYFCLLLHVPEAFSISHFIERAVARWSERLSDASSHVRMIDPVQWLEEVACSPFGRMQHVDEAIWAAYYFRMDKCFRSPGDAAFA